MKTPSPDRDEPGDESDDFAPDAPVHRSAARAALAIWIVGFLVLLASILFDLLGMFR